MRGNTQARGTSRRTAGAVLLVGALVLGGCGDGGDAASQPPSTNQHDAGHQPEDSGDADNVAAQETDRPAPPTDMTAQDGFNGPLPVEHDHAPGTGELAIGNERIAMAVTCTDHTQSSERLFWLDAHGEGEDADGHRTTAQAQRQIMREPDRFYDYGGQEEGNFLAGRFVDGLFMHHALASPADRDRTGANLPITWVTEDGRFAAVADFEPSSFQLREHPQVPQGEVVFTGTCQDDWPGPIMGGA